MTNTSAAAEAVLHAVTNALLPGAPPVTPNSIMWNASTVSTPGAGSVTTGTTKVYVDGTEVDNTGSFHWDGNTSTVGNVSTLLPHSRALDRCNPAILPYLSPNSTTQQPGLMISTCPMVHDCLVEHINDVVLVMAQFGMDRFWLGIKGANTTSTEYPAKLAVHNMISRMQQVSPEQLQSQPAGVQSHRRVDSGKLSDDFDKESSQALERFVSVSESLFDFLSKLYRLGGAAHAKEAAQFEMFSKRCRELVKEEEKLISDAIEEEEEERGVAAQAVVQEESGSDDVLQDFM